MHPENPQGTRLDSALDAYCAQARTVKRPGLAQATAYTAAAGAALALAPSADAAIQYSGPQNLSVAGEGTATINMNLLGDDEFKLRLLSDEGEFSIKLIPFSSNNTQWLNHIATTGTFQPNIAKRLAAGNSINGGAQAWAALDFGLLRNGDSVLGSFLGAINPASWSWPGGTMNATGAGFLGVRFNISGNTHYGWIRVGISNDAGGIPVALTVYDWAYNDVAGEGITAGQTIPEPSPAAGLALLAAGAAGVATWRRRKQPAKA